APGSEREAYVVGGTVRDVLLGRATRDIDVAIAGDARGWAREAASELGAHFVTLNDEHDVARLVLPQSDGLYVDVARLAGTVEQDARRRDFTIDALAVPLVSVPRGLKAGATAEGEGGWKARATGDIIDVCGGVADLDAQLVRMNGADVLDADPLRCLRGVRLAAELGFDIEASTLAAIRERAGSLDRAAAERRRDELARILEQQEAYRGVRLLDEAGLLDELLPELAEGRGVEQPEQFHVYDVFEHNLRAVEALDEMLRPEPRGFLGAELWRTFAWCAEELRAYLDEPLTEGRPRVALVKLAALLHDVAKPRTRSVEGDGRTRFFGHADEGARMATAAMVRLRFSTRETEFVRVLVAEHLRPVQLAQAGEAPTRRALYRFYRDLDDAAPAVLLLALADAAAARGPSMTREGWSRQAAYMNGLLVRSKEEEGIIQPPRLVSGHDIMSVLGLPEGPAIGRLLEALREAQAAGEVHDTEEALAFVRALAREGTEEP
ncbi:MAG: HD domain-containing protein, partial [Dehalococcoidia bacterium]